MFDKGVKMNRTVVITGASRGIGAAIALKFAELGYNIVINYNNSYDDAMQVLKKVQEFGSLAIAVKADVSKYDEAKKLVYKVCEQFGRVDILVNNAGIAEQKLFTMITESEWKHMFDVNVNSMFNCCKFVVPVMIKNHSGKIINISSVWGLKGASCEVHYSASKAAVIGFTKALSKELGPSGITVNCVAPGVIDTGMNSHLNSNDIKNLIKETPLDRIGTPEDVAGAVAYFGGKDSDFVTGQVLEVGGGFGD